MAVSIPIPSATPRSTLVVDTFSGVDYTNQAGNVKTGMSPNGQNMIRDVPGKIRKCMGYHTVATYPARINGRHALRGDSASEIIHAGTVLYKDGVSIYADANDARSKSWQFGSKLYIMDGKKLLCYDGTSVTAVEGNGTVPTVTIAKTPKGGGTPYYDLNLMQPKFTEMFAGTATDKVYQLTFGGLDAAAVEVSILQSDGSWLAKTEGTDFTVNRTTGAITFMTAPGTSLVTGEDNVKITASRTVAGYADRINKCCFGTLFGVNGAADRIFAAGNPEHKNWDWYCDKDDPTYWPDTGYNVLGTEASAIVGYTIINNYLACHKDKMEDGRNIIIRQGNLVDNEPAFPIYNTLQGPGAVAPYSFAYLNTEPIFLTESGIYSVTASDITGEKYTQSRGYYIREKLIAESGLADAFACVHKDLYWLCLNGVAYIIDGTKKIATDSKSDPYSTRQYACYYRTNLPARVMWENDGTLCFGGDDGKVRNFYTDPTSILSYNDDGTAIDAIWETPDYSGNLFFQNKSFKYLAVQLSAAAATSISVSGQRFGLWQKLYEDNSTGRYLCFDQIVFDKFTFSSDLTNKTIGRKIRLPKVDKARFRFENNELNEPFGLMAYALEFTEHGKYKG